MKGFKKLITLILAALLIVTVFTACGGGDDENVITVLCVENLARLGEDQSTPVSLALEKKFGKKFKFTTPSDHNEVGNTLGRFASSGNIPDLVITQTIEINKFPKNFVNYASYRSKMPNMFSYIDEPEVSKLITLQDGTIIASPTILEIQTQVAYMIRTDWLDYIDEDIPVTVNDFADIMRKFSTKDPNGDGVATKEFGFYPMGAMSWLREYANNFGASPDNIIKDGQVKYGPLEPEYKTAVMHLNELYGDGVFDPEMLTGTLVDFKAHVANGKIGFTRAYYNRVEDVIAWSRTKSQNAQWQIILPPVAADGNRYEQSHTGRVGNMGIAINKRSKKIDLLVELVDYLYSEEGRLLTSYGVEGVTYEMEDGVPVFKDAVTNNNKWSDSLTVKTYYGIEPQTHFAMVQNRDSFIFRQEALDGLDLYESNSVMYDNMPSAPPVTLIINYSDTERSAALTDWYDIQRREIAKTAEFITGSRPISAWNTYMGELQSLGVANCITKINQAYQRTR